MLDYEEVNVIIVDWSKGNHAHRKMGSVTTEKLFSVTTEIRFFSVAIENKLKSDRNVSLSVIDEISLSTATENKFSCH